MLIGLDFDGTVVEHAYPNVGKDVGAVPVLKAMVAQGHLLILFTMRSGEMLAHAVEWFARHDIPLYGINENPTQHTWTESPKVYAHVYLDDSALGCPLIQPKDGSRSYVDWVQVAKAFGIEPPTAPIVNSSVKH